MKKKGFTLMELIIVIVIIGILVAAMLPMFASSTDKARMGKVQSELDAIKTSVLMYYTDTGNWPVASNSSQNDGKGLTSDGFSVSNWNGPYIDSWKNDPWGHAYVLKRAADVSGVVKTITVRSWGAAGAEKSTACSATVTSDCNWIMTIKP